MKYFEKHPMLMILVGIIGISIIPVFNKNKRKIPLWKSTAARL